ncbi:MAG TPA: hypothetical protein ENH43_01625 [Phycisphaerales bacterium]|nr:hypothetical protein [Phycisphaerales bacterium]
MREVGLFGASVSMYIRQRKIIRVISILLIGSCIAGCGEPAGTTDKPKELAPKIDLGTTIGAMAEVFLFDAIPVESYNLVGGLNGTGSVECPPQIRTYLEKYIMRKLPNQNVEKVISSRNTAVVSVYGLMPAAVSKNQYFDVRVAALPGTQTTSLEGGWLYGAELKVAGSFGITTKVVATAEGPVFIDTINGSATNKKVGYILAGGRVLNEYKISLALRQPDYKIASLIRNLLNERFGNDVARAVSPSQIELRVPAEYREQKRRFISIVKATYLAQTQEVTKKRISTFVRKLAASKDKEQSEIALEAIGNKSLGKLAALLNSSNEQVRLRAARCMLNLGSDQGLKTLRKIAMDKKSSYRVEALEAITTAANRNEAAAISRRLLRDEDFDIRLAAYESLRKLDNIAVTQKLIAGNFYLEQIAQTKRKAIFVSRSGQPRIVLFGAPIYCKDNIFVQSADGNITINAPAGQKYVSIIRKHPKRPNITVQLRSSFELGDIIQTLCEEPLKKTGRGHLGLNVSYADMITLLKQMSDKGAVQAEFRAGPLPKIGLIIKKRQTTGR